jgi:hypothetical protein
MTIIRCNLVVAEQITATALLTWVYRDQKADRMSGKDLYTGGPPKTIGARSENYHGGWSGDGCAAAAEIGRIGTLIRGTGQHQRPALHPDAEAVHDLMVELSKDDPLGARLLCRHARRDDQPDFSDEIPCPGPVRRQAANHRMVTVEDACLPGNSHVERRHRRLPGTTKRTYVWVEVPHLFCPLDYQPSPAAIAESRIEYVVWWRALVKLAAQLPKLGRWQVTGLGAVEIPWSWSETCHDYNSTSTNSANRLELCA